MKLFLPLMLIFIGLFCVNNLEARTHFSIGFNSFNNRPVCYRDNYYRPAILPRQAFYQEHVYVGSRAPYPIYLQPIYPEPRPVIIKTRPSFSFGFSR